MQTSLNEANYKLCPRWKFYRSCSFMSGTTWQCKDNSTFKASACFDSIFFLVRGRSRSGQSLKIDLLTKKKTPKKKQNTKGRKIKKRETQTKNTALHDICNVVRLKFMRMHWMFTKAVIHLRKSEIQIHHHQLRHLYTEG